MHSRVLKGDASQALSVPDLSMSLSRAQNEYPHNVSRSHTL